MRRTNKSTKNRRAVKDKEPAYILRQYSHGTSVNTLSDRSNIQKGVGREAIGRYCGDATKATLEKHNLVGVGGDESPERPDREPGS